VLLCLGEQRAQRLGDVREARIGRLLDALAVALQLLGLQLQVGPECCCRVGAAVGGRDRRGRIAAQEGHLLGQGRRVVELLGQVDLELVDGAQVLGTSDGRDVCRVLDDRLELQAKVLIEGGDQLGGVVRCHRP